MKNEQKILTEELIRASKEYYNNGQSFLSDIEFDKKIDELIRMEQESGEVLLGSPTQNVGVKVEGLKTTRHEYPALSLAKVKYKDREDLTKWLGDHDGVLSWKADGSTIVATYDNGKLTQVVTRGNGEEGSDITHNAKFFKGLPVKINYSGHLVIRGEAMMTNKEFERINDECGGIYENARNLATATIQMLDAKESRKREIIFKAFKLVSPTAESDAMLTTESSRFEWLKSLGVDVIPWEKVNTSNVLEKIEDFKERLSSLDYPTDGLVLSYDNQLYANSLGMTGHHPRGSIAMKWTDETKETILRNIEWSVGKTGIITPVAEFDTVRLGLGSDVSRASMHNLSIMKKLDPHINGKVSVYLANLIIPQIAEAWGEGNDIIIPDNCPICGQPVTVEKDSKSGVEVLHCNNTDCPARVRGSLENTFSKSGLFVKGLGPSQLEDLQGVGLIGSHPVDVFTLRASVCNSGAANAAYHALMEKDGWGEKSWNNLLDAIDDARHTDLQHFLYALNIPLLGNDLSKKLSKYWNGSIEAFEAFVRSVGTTDATAAVDQLTQIDGVGLEKASNIAEWCLGLNRDSEAYNRFINLIEALSFKETSVTAEQSLNGMTFVITGSVNIYKNRDEFKASVEARGGKVAGSVSNKTSYLVNNDVTSTSGKNKKAKELGVEIISEEDFIAKFGK